MNVGLGTGLHSFMSGKICFEFLVQCLCSVEAKVDPILLNKCIT
jgi:hypothetical protein